MTAFSFGMPLIFGRPEGDAIHRAGEMPVVSVCAIIEKNLHRVLVVLIAVDQHHRPLSVRTLDRIGCDQQGPGSVGHITRNFEEFVRGIHGLHPLLGDHLGSHVLRRIADQLIVFVDQEQRICAPVSRRRHVVEIISSAGARGHHGSNIVGQP